MILKSWKKFNEKSNYDVYNNSLDDDYWVKISKKFPEYNDPNSDDCKKAVEYVYSNMKKKYPDEDWNKIEKGIKDSIHAGIT